MASPLPKQLTWHWSTFSVKFLGPTWHETYLATKYWQGGSLVAKSNYFNVDAVKLTWQRGLTWLVTVAK